MPTSAARRLAGLDTCEVSDALDRLGLGGAVHGIHSVWPCGRISGAVVTVQLRRPRPGERPRVHLGATAIDLAKPGDVIVIAHGGRDDAAGWGGLLSLAASLKGVAGVIVDGACRDVDDSREVGFPVYARTAVPSTARARVIEDATGVVVDVGGVAVRPGDLVVADGSGVVFVPATRADAVLGLAEALAQEESRMAADLREGCSVRDVLGTRYELMLEPGENAPHAS